MSPTVLGWDIGGVNTKVARLEAATDGPVIRSAGLPFELKDDTAGLTPTLTEAAPAVGATTGDLHAVTMTAELSQAFRTKREGVGFVLDALQAAFPRGRLQVYSVEGRFIGPLEARALPLSVGSANWAARAILVARSIPTCMLIDIGTTSADLRLGRLSPEDYTCRTPDGRPPTRDFAGERLARTVCADRDMLDDSALDAIARALAGAQVRAVAEALGRILKRWPVIRSAVVAGLGDFIAVEAGEAVGLDIVRLADRLGSSARTAPAAAVAWLLWYSMESRG